MIVLKAGAYVAVDTVAMSLDEAFAVKTELKARGTKASLRLAYELGMPAQVVHRVDSDKRMEEIRERVQWMIDRLDSSRLGNAANDGIIDICNRLQQPLNELAKLVGIDAAQQNNRESPGAGRGIPSTAKRGSESGRTPPSRESVAQEGRRSNTGY